MTEQEIAGQAIQTALVNVGISAALGYVLLKIITRRKPTSYGRVWFAWYVFVATLTFFPRVLLHQFDLNAVAQWLVMIFFLGPVAWVLGWAYGKLKGPPNV